MLVSIIITHFNRSELLRKAVDSVLKQTNSEWELLIVDDNSDISEFIKIKELQCLDERIKVLSRRSTYKGPSSCRNEGVAAAKGEYLIFLDSDDALAPYCVAQRIKLMEENTELDMGIFLMNQFTVTPGDSDKIYNNKSTNENRINCFLEGNNPWAVTGPIWRKDFFKQTGGFDESFFYMEDPELHVRALLQDGMLYKTFYDYPADCYYRINFHDATKKDFYKNSIRYRTRFYKKMEELIAGKPTAKVSYKKSFERGVINFFSSFLLSRINEFPQLHAEFMGWTDTSKLLSPLMRLKIKILSAIFRKDNFLTRKLHLKGLALNILIPGVVG